MLDLPSSFYENRLGSVYNYQNRTGSCSQLMSKRSNNLGTIPSSFNWADYGVLTPIKSQKHCGSCVTFGTIGSSEAAYHLQLGKPLTNFSEQDVVNCFANFGRGGCAGSWPDEVLEFIMVRGLEKSEFGSGPQSDYAGKVMNCNAERSSPVPEMIRDYCSFVSLANDQMLMSLIYDFGPMIVPISNYDNTIHSLKNSTYKTGCGTTKRGHVMLAVGWTEEYFIFKNSWTSTWGNNGFLHLARNENTKLCNYLNFAAVPIFRAPSESLGAKYEFEYPF